MSFMNQLILILTWYQFSIVSSHSEASSSSGHGKIVYLDEFGTNPLARLADDIKIHEHLGDVVDTRDTHQVDSLPFDINELQRNGHGSNHRISYVTGKFS